MHSTGPISELYIYAKVEIISLSVEFTVYYMNYRITKPNYNSDLNIGLYLKGFVLVNGEFDQFYRLLLTEMAGNLLYSSIENAPVLS